MSLCKECGEYPVYPKYGAGRCKACYLEDKAAQYRRYKDKHPERCLLAAAKSRALARGLPFSLKESDIVIPELCPVLGVPLRFGRISRTPNSPSLDRLVPSLGYVPGNVVVMSERANRIKNDADAATLRKVADFLESAVAGTMGKDHA